MNKEQFFEELKKINITINENQYNQLLKYYEILIEENKKYNLTGITIKEDVFLKHFYDSLTLNMIIDINNQKICDIGSGAGFPGVVLKILFPNIIITLVDSSEKRCHFLKLLINELNLTNIEVVNKRAEEYTIDNNEKFDIITARAVSNLKELLEISISALKVNGHFIAMKSNIKEEINNIDNCLYCLACSIEEIKEFKLPYEQSIRTLVKIKKNKPTNKKFPRKYSIIKKNPL